MSKRDDRHHAQATPSEPPLGGVEDDLLDAVVTGAALVARADGWVEPVERGQLFDVLDRYDFLSVFSRAEIVEVFERRVRHLREPGGALAAVDLLRRYAGRAPSYLILDIGEEIAAADCWLDPRERRVLLLIRNALSLPLSPGSGASAGEAR